MVDSKIKSFFYNNDIRLRLFYMAILRFGIIFRCPKNKNWDSSYTFIIINNKLYILFWFDTSDRSTHQTFEIIVL